MPNVALGKAESLQFFTVMVGGKLAVVVSPSFFTHQGSSTKTGNFQKEIMRPND
jgi:hypothetical protein